MRLPRFVYAIIGKYISKKLGLEENVDGEKSKWKSKGFWAGVVTVVVGLYTLVDANLAPQLGFDLPEIPVWIFTILGAMGVYGRVTATKKLK